MGFFEEALRQVPALTVLAAIVYFFLRHIQGTNQHVDRLISRTEETIKNLSGSYREAAKECHAVQKRAVEAIGENSEILRELKDLVKAANGKKR